MKLAQFQAVAALNLHGLVAMEVVSPFAPYSAGDIAGFPPEQALDLYVAGEATPLEVLEADDDDTDDTDETQAVADVEIPAEWQGLHHLKRVKLAGEIAGRKVGNKEEADEVIAAEVARRAEDAASQT